MEDKIEDKVNFDDLLVNIKSTRNVNEIKHKLDRDHWIDARDKQWEEDGRKAAEKAREKRQRKQKKLPFEVDEAEEQAELQAAQAQRQKDRQRKKVLDAPLHRQAQQRIEGRLAYRQTKNELRQWQPIVDGLRQAEQLQFPHEERQDNPLRVETAEERANGFTPRTELELRIAEALGNSKSNIRNNEEFSEAEKELLKAMDLKEAKRKCEELRKMRALVSFHAAKMKRQSRIKSKQFHRVRKRQQRRELIKEVEGLLVRDPARAGERVEELERDRAYERATLKHRGTNKWTKQVRKFASRNPELRKVMEDQLRLGRELKGKHGAEGEGEDSGSDELMDEFDEEETVKQPESSQQMVHKAAEMAAADQLKVGDASSGDKLSTILDNPFCRTALENIRRERKVAAKQARKRAASSAGGDNAHSKTGMDGIGDGKTVDQPDFLDLNVRQIVQIPSELADGIDLDADLQHSFLADAYEDDGVIEEFQARKEKEEEGPGENKPSRYALMRGWGSWTGEGISEEREKQRMDRILGQEVKKKDNRRKYAQQKGVIIREPVSEGVQKLQPRDVPFPFTRIQDFEAYIQQPLGRDWNTSIAHQQLTQPPVATKAGRIIAPLSKEVKYRRKQFTEMIIGQQD